MRRSQCCLKHLIQSLYQTRYPYQIKFTAATTHWCGWTRTFWINQLQYDQGMTKLLPHLLLEIIRAIHSPIQYFNFSKMWTEYAPHIDRYSFALLIRCVENRRLLYQTKQTHPHLYTYLTYREEPLRDIPALIPYFHTFCLALANKKRLYTYKVRAPIAHSLSAMTTSLIKYEHSGVQKYSLAQVPVIFETQIKPFLRGFYGKSQKYQFSLEDKYTMLLFWKAWSELAPFLLPQAYDLYYQDIQRISGFMNIHPHIEKQTHSYLQQRQCACLLSKIQLLKPNMKLPNIDQLQYSQQMLQQMSQEIEIFDESLIYARQHAYQSWRIDTQYKPSQNRNTRYDDLVPIWSYYHQRIKHSIRWVY